MEVRCTAQQASNRDSQSNRTAHRYVPFHALHNREWPHVTRLGTTYEHAAISLWLKTKTTDPLSNAELESVELIPNLALRSQIQDWIQANPEAAEMHRNLDAKKPPKAPVASASPFKEGGRPKPEVGEGSDKARLAKIMHYSGASTVADHSSLPSPVKAENRTYEFRQNEGTLEIRCSKDKEGTSTAWMPMPGYATRIFVSPLGTVFYDPSDLQDTRVRATGTVCKWGARCTDKVRPLGFHAVDCKC